VGGPCSSLNHLNIDLVTELFSVLHAQPTLTATMIMMTHMHLSSWVSISLANLIVHARSQFLVETCSSSSTIVLVVC
jgi:hypothetical protein